MKTVDNLVVLRSPSDRGIEQLCIEQMDWIKENFTTILIGAIPHNIKDQAVIDYFSRLAGTYRFNITVLLNNIPNLTQDDARFMDTLYQEGADLATFIDRKISILQSILRHAKNPMLEQALTQMNKIVFYRSALARGIELQGMEQQQQFSNSGASQHREQTMLDFIEYSNRQGKRIFIVLGADHGVPMIEKLQASPSVYTTHFIRLSTDQQYYAADSHFAQWINQFATRAFHLPYLGAFTLISARLTTEQLAAAVQFDFKVCNDPLLHYDYGVFLFKAKMFDRAIDHLEYAITLFPADAESLPKIATAHSTIASCYRDAGQLGEAKIRCEIALSVYSDHKIDNPTAVAAIQKKLEGIEKLQTEQAFSSSSASAPRYPKRN